MKRVLKKVLPRSVVSYLKKKLLLKSFIISSVRDAHRFYKKSGVFDKSKSESSSASLVTIDYHRLEKGLALPNPRKGFGKTAATDLQRNMKTFIKDYGVRPIILEAISALSEYYQYNEMFVDEEKELYADFLGLKNLIENEGCLISSTIAGTIEITRQEVLASVELDYKKFFLNRHSIRSFSDRKVDRTFLMDAVSIAQQAPSVCNRQPWKVFCVESEEQVGKFLSIHGGARGFEDGPDKLMVVTVDLGAFHYLGERNEYWVDGGIFTMSLLNAIHAVGLAACCLNWCVDDARDKVFREELAVSDSSVIIALIAVGHYPDNFRVAVSPTKATTEAIVFCG